MQPPRFLLVPDTKAPQNCKLFCFPTTDCVTTPDNYVPQFQLHVPPNKMFHSLDKASVVLNLSITTEVSRLLLLCPTLLWHLDHPSSQTIQSVVFDIDKITVQWQNNDPATIIILKDHTDTIK